jgi:hypothetical protein
MWLTQTSRSDTPIPGAFIGAQSPFPLNFNGGGRCPARVLLLR